MFSSALKRETRTLTRTQTTKNIKTTIASATTAKQQSKTGDIKRIKYTLPFNGFAAAETIQIYPLFAGCKRKHTQGTANLNPDWGSLNSTPFRRSVVQLYLQRGSARPRRRLRRSGIPGYGGTPTLFIGVKKPPQPAAAASASVATRALQLLLS